MKDEDAWGHWLAGFTAGEGHFALNCGRKQWWHAQFVLGLRDDDEPILRQLQGQFGGRLYHKRSPGSRPGERPSIYWQVFKRTEVMSLVNLFRRFPIRAKKQRDFELWALAVEHLAQRPPGGYDRVYLQALHDALVATRDYTAGDLAIPDEPQLRLMDERRTS